MKECITENQTQPVFVLVS